MFTYRTVTDNQYELATHTVKVRRSGMLSDVIVMWDMKNSDMVTGSAQSELVTNKLKIERLPSINCFNKVCELTSNRFGLCKVVVTTTLHKLTYRTLLKQLLEVFRESLN